MLKSDTARVKLGTGVATVTYKRLDAVAKPDAKVGHHDFVEHAKPAEVALERLHAAIKKGK